ncbi:TadE/TadG family type IV pilus assembly protein [Phenylobacterium sp.]|uniref:TadE/TadG family type IV pilus assembly protein n=1 Tax=Phenylobacterium sp. TaxID=1871053 RepID=UPI0035B374FC
MTVGVGATSAKGLARRFLGETGGAAAAEFVLWLALLIFPVLNAVDLGVYAFQRMQLDLAAQAGVQAAWYTCNSKDFLPATENCPELSNAVATAVQSTSLGEQISLDAGSPVEGWYCTDEAQTLQAVGDTWTIGDDPTAKPANCDAVISGSKTAPGDYIQVTVSYDYTPVFSGVTVASMLTTPMKRTAWMRLN